MKRINVLSLFDGLACGMLAFMKAGVQVNNYYAYEIDKYAIQTAKHNFPQIQECGDVFKADFKQYQGIDYLIGGSPCTYWSIAQSPDKRETTASGIGWELFSQYVRALHEAKPKYFIYENNKSMAKAIYNSISETFGFEPIMINSALVSAQNRQRLYWVGKRNADGTYSKVDVQQPEDRGILLRDVLDGFAIKEKSPCIDANYYKGGNYTNVKKQSGQRMCCAEPVNTTIEGKSQTLKAQYSKTNATNICCYNSTYGASGVAEPVCVASRGRYSDTESRSSKTDAPTYQHYEARTDGKTNAVTTVSKDNLIGEPVCMRYERSERAKQLRKDYESGAIKHGYHEFSELHPRQDGKTNTLSTVLKDNPICEPVIKPVCLNSKSGRNGKLEIQPSLSSRIYSIDGKGTTVTGGFHPQIAIPVKAISAADGKTYTVCEVKDGNITIKGKTYPIKLTDGYYIIRKLTVSECKRLQTVPEWYEFPVSNTQAYKMLGNGWTVDVIAHLIEATRR